MRRSFLALAVLAAALLAPGSPASASGVNPLAARPFSVDPDTWATWAAGRPDASSAAKVIAAVPQTRWITSGTATGAVRAEVDRYVGASTKAGRLPLLTLYAIPHRDCGSYSAGGMADQTAYAAWVAQVVEGIAGRSVAVVLEPDALSSSDCLQTAARSARYAMLSDAVRRLTVAPATTVYIDIGHSRWLSPADAAARLQKAGVTRARGFSLNVSNFYTTGEEVAYGERIADLLGGQHYVVDTSRNGLGPAPSVPLNWCNPSGRGLGVRPTTVTTGTHADAYLWIKHPGESDGDCRPGEPTSGTWFESYAVGLVQRAVLR